MLLQDRSLIPDLTIAFHVQLETRCDSQVYIAISLKQMISIFTFSFLSKMYESKLILFRVNGLTVQSLRGNGASVESCWAGPGGGARGYK